MLLFSIQMFSSPVFSANKNQCMWPYEVNSCNSNFSQSVNLPAQGLRGHLSMISVDFFCRSGEDGHARGRSDERGERALWDLGSSVRISVGLMETIEDYTGFFRSLWTGAFLPVLLASLWISNHKELLYPIHLKPPIVCVWTHTCTYEHTWKQMHKHTNTFGVSLRGTSFAPVYLFFFPPQYIYIEWI